MTCRYKGKKKCPNIKKYVAPTLFTVKDFGVCKSCEFSEIDMLDMFQPNLIERYEK